MSNEIRTRDGLPFDFKDGLKIKGVDTLSLQGGHALAIRASAQGTTPMLLQAWIDLVNASIDQLIESGLGDEASTAPDRALSDDSSYIANTRYVHAILAQTVSGLVGSAPSSLNTIAELAQAINNDPQVFTTITDLLADKASYDDLRGTLSTFANAGPNANSISASFTPAITELKDGMLLRVRTTGANTLTTVSFSPDDGAIPAKAVVKGSNQPLLAGDLPAAGFIAYLQYDRSIDKWVLINPAYPVQLPHASDAEAVSGTLRTKVINPATLKAALENFVGNAPTTLNSIAKIAAAVGNDPNFYATISQALLAKANIDSPALTGSPTATTAAATDNSQRIANMMAVQAAIQYRWVRASTATVGVTRFATVAETLVGGLEDVAVTPLGLKAYVANAISGAATPPNAPLIVGNSTAITGTNHTIALSATATQSGASIAHFLVAIDGGAPTNVTAASGAASFTWQASKPVGQSSTVSAVSVDTNGKSSGAAAITVTMITVVVNPPTITSPTSAATNLGLTPTFTTAAYATTGGSDAHYSTDWEVRTASGGGGTLIQSSLASVTNLLNWVLVTPLAANTTYFIRVRHRSTGYGASAWSETSFTTRKASAVSILAPTEGLLGVSITPTISATAFSAITASDTHLSSDWEIRTATNGGGTLLASAMASTISKTSWTAPAAALGLNTTYFARVRYNGSVSGASDWAEVSFTSGYVGQPIILTPTNGSNGHSLTPTFTTGPFTASGSDTHLASDWEVRTQAGGAGTAVVNVVSSASAYLQYTVSAGALQPSTTYYLRTRHRGVVFGYSVWAEVMFTTGTATVPTIITPTSGSTGVSLSPSFTASAYSAADSHASSDWELRTAANGGGTLAASSIASTTNKTTWTSGAVLAHNTTYYLRVRYYGTNYGYSAWGEASFTTGFVSAPVWSSPVAGTTNSGVYRQAIVNSFAAVGNVVHVSTDWEIRTATNGGGTLMAEYPAEVAQKLELSISKTNGLIGGVQYFIRARFNTDTMGKTAWSETNFTTGLIATPSFVAPISGTTGVATTVTFSTSAFSASTATQLHTSSDWEVRTGSNGSGTLIASSTTDTVNKTSWKPASPLANSTTYYVRVRYSGDTFGYTPWSEIQFTTAAQLTGPNISTSQYLGIGTASTIALSASPVAPATSIATFAATLTGLGTFSAAAASNAATVTIPASTTATYTASTVTLTATYVDNNNNTSLQSTMANIKIGKVIAATFTAPLSGATNAGTNPTLTTAAFASSNSLDVHKHTDWEIRTASGGGGTLVWQSLANTANKTSIVPGVSLAANTVYYARARHVGTYWVGTEVWSEVYFTTASAIYISTPTLYARGWASNATILDKAADYGNDAYYTDSFSTDIVSYVNGTGVVINAEAEITDLTDGTVRTTLSYVYSVGGLVGQVATIVNIPYCFNRVGVEAVAGRNYSVRVRYLGDQPGTGNSAWSNSLIWKIPAYAAPTLNVPPSTNVAPTNVWECTLPRTYSADYQYQLEYQFSTDSSFTNVIGGEIRNVTVPQVINDAGGGYQYILRESFQGTNLFSLTTYFLRVRTLVWVGTMSNTSPPAVWATPTKSAWTTPHQFTTKANVGTSWAAQATSTGGMMAATYAQGLYYIVGYSIAGDVSAGAIWSSSVPATAGSWIQRSLNSASGAFNTCYFDGRYVYAGGYDAPGNGYAGALYFRDTGMESTVWRRVDNYPAGTVWDMVRTPSGLWVVGTSRTNGVTPTLTRFNSADITNNATPYTNYGNPWPAANSWARGIAYSPSLNLYVACGENLDGTGWAYWATDPAGTWTAITLPATCGMLDGLEWSALQGKFVMVGLGAPNTASAGVVFTSTDGKNWTKQTFTGGGLSDVKFASSQWVAVGYSTSGSSTAGGVYTSTDATSWVQRSVGSGRLRGVSTDGSLMLAVGYTSAGSATAGSAATS